jgi:hypothetical protein
MTHRSAAAESSAMPRRRQRARAHLLRLAEDTALGFSGLLASAHKGWRDRDKGFEDYLAV